jgi:hypothetical protein
MFQNVYELKWFLGVIAVYFWNNSTFEPFESQIWFSDIFSSTSLLPTCLCACHPSRLCWRGLEWRLLINLCALPYVWDCRFVPGYECLASISAWLGLAWLPHRNSILYTFVCVRYFHKFCFDHLFPNEFKGARALSVLKVHPFISFLTWLGKDLFSHDTLWV